MTDRAESPRFRQGSGRLCLDFVRTLRYRGTPEAAEELDDPEALVAWVRQCGPRGEDPAEPVNRAHPARRVAPSEPAATTVPLPDAERLGVARELREAVYALMTAVLGPRGVSGVSAADRERLNRAAAEDVPAPRLDPAGRLVWRSADPVAATLALIARDALDLATSPSLLARVHPCASPTCGALFLDHSRPGTRRWCSMDICGNRAKKAALRAR
jgi:predicted RNA-binding Zn ribbon-like protein